MSRPNLSAETSRPDAPQAAGRWAVFWAMLKSLYQLLLSGSAEAEARFLAFEQQFTDELLRLAIAEAGLKPNEGMRLTFHKGRYDLVFDDPPESDDPVGALPYTRDDLLRFIADLRLLRLFQRLTWFAERFARARARHWRTSSTRRGLVRAVLSARAGTPAVHRLAAARAPP